MNILIQPLDKSVNGRWQVRLDRHCVSFRNEEQARQFVTTLEARLRAPHDLPWREQRQAS